LLPRSGLERSDFVHWEQSGKHLLAVRIDNFDPERTSRCFGIGAKIKILAT
jgi:hypothetical protein